MSGSTPAATAAKPRPRRVAVVVLGDLARSPRMLRHAECLAAEGIDVDVVAYVDTPCDLGTEGIRVWPLRSPESARRRRPRFASAAARLVRDCAGVAAAVWRSRPESVLVQNPPAVHVLPILRLVCRWRRCRLVVDWHNFGWTMLALRRGAGRMVAAAERLEIATARGADLHLCVSEAMRRRLAERHGVAAVVFRDRPSTRLVAAAGTASRASLRAALLPALELPDETAAKLVDGGAALLVSSTSWTADEDFSVLLQALRGWADAAPRLPLIVVVSGRGPGRAAYERAANATRLSGVSFRTVWLGDGDYARMLAAADLGLCFHRSSSGVDLPMKLADMLGAGLPACVLDYGPCVREMVRDGENGFLFSDAADLVGLWNRLLVERPSRLAETRERLRREAEPTWEEHWREVVLPLIRADRDERGVDP